MDLANGFVLPGDGSGTMNVLFITGNYYDINVLEQTNIVSDSDVVLQTLENGESGYVATGANELANDALLVTLGPLGGQHVGGAERLTDITLALGFAHVQDVVADAVGGRRHLLAAAGLDRECH